MKPRLTRYFAFLAGFSIMLVAIIAGISVVTGANPLNKGIAMVLGLCITFTGSIFGGGLCVYGIRRRMR